MKLIKKFFPMLFALMLMINVCDAAGMAESVDNPEELAQIKRLAIYYPDYYPVYKDEPKDVFELMSALYEAGRVSKTYIIPFDEIASKIKGDTGVDIKVISKIDARKIFKEQAYKYADAYLYVTVANNAKINIFYDVYLVNTNERIYSLQLAGGKSDYEKSVKSYKSITETFYKTFDKAVQEAEKNLNKK